MFLLIVGVAIVIASLYDTWWMGFIIGAVLGLVALVFRNADRMFQSAMQALGVVLVIAVLCGGIGYLYGHGALAKTGVGWPIPTNVVDRTAFITAGTIHNFSYLGGAIGLAGGIIFLLVKNRRMSER